MRESTQLSAWEAAFHRSIPGEEAVLVKGQGFTSLMCTQGEGQDVGKQRVRCPFCLGALGACPSLLGRNNSRGTLQQDKGVSLQLKVVEQLAKLMGDVTAATVVSGRKGKEVFVGWKGFGVSDVVQNTWWSWCHVFKVEERSEVWWSKQ